MTLLDDPVARILRLFEMEVHRGFGADCQRFEKGIRPDGVPLCQEELVFGVYKGKYYFTPMSFVQKTSEGFERIAWNEIESCSSEHGSGTKIATLELVDGGKAKVRVGDMATGWAGRISQLFHAMIEKHGATGFVGLPLYSVEEFFSATIDEYSLFPNLEPHPTRAELTHALRVLQREASVTRVLLHVVELDTESPVADGVIVCALEYCDAMTAFGERFGADGILEADEGIKKKLGGLAPQEHAWQLVWD